MLYKMNLEINFPNKIMKNKKRFQFIPISFIFFGMFCHFGERETYSRTKMLNLLLCCDVYTFSVASNKISEKNEKMLN